MSRMILYNASQIATPRGNQLKHGEEMNRLWVIKDGAIVIEDGIISSVGTTKEIFAEFGITLESLQKSSEKKLANDSQISFMDLTGKTVLPGFVDSHTHFIFGGYRPEEFMMRLKGSSYMDIMRMGGGIQSTVDATRKADFSRLYHDGLKRLTDMMTMGVTTVEGKSGYGLDLLCEEKQLQIMKKLNEDQPLDIAATYLGAHAVPREYKKRPNEYIDYIIKEVLPIIASKGLAQFCDVFCEDGVFNTAQSERLLLAAKDLGFDLKIHADEIVPLGGGELAANLGAASADHLLAVSDEGIRLLAESDTCATLLPCTAFCLNKPYAPARKMIDSGCALALASDYNPGSCFTNSIPLMLSLAVINMGMTLAEAICALTLNGAAALKRADTIGTIEPGKKADLLILSYPDYRFLVYHTGKNIVEHVLKDGKLVL